VPPLGANGNLQGKNFLFFPIFRFTRSKKTYIKMNWLHILRKLPSLT